jgi:hypothetical protein
MAGAWHRSGARCCARVCLGALGRWRRPAPEWKPRPYHRQSAMAWPPEGRTSPCSANPTLGNTEDHRWPWATGSPAGMESRRRESGAVKAGAGISRRPCARTGLRALRGFGARGMAGRPPGRSPARSGCAWLESGTCGAPMQTPAATRGSGSGSERLRCQTQDEPGGRLGWVQDAARGFRMYSKSNDPRTGRIRGSYTARRAGSSCRRRRRRVSDSRGCGIHRCGYRFRSCRRFRRTAAR